MSVLESFDQWKSFLAERVNQAQQMGMKTGTIANVAYQIGDYLAVEVDPQNREERLLQELWKVADENEQKAMANLMVKLVQEER
jgi:Asp/Glu/hydantoin racemase